MGHPITSSTSHHHISTAQSPATASAHSLALSITSLLLPLRPILQTTRNHLNSSPLQRGRSSSRRSLSPPYQPQHPFPKDTPTSPSLCPSKISRPTTPSPKPTRHR